MSIRFVEKNELRRHAQKTGCYFVFYDRFVKICNERGISPSKAAIEAGLSKSTVTKWKTTPDAEPTGTAIKKICAFFNIPVSELLGENEKEQPSENEGLSLNNISEEDAKAIKAFLEMPEDQRRLLARMLGISE